jgi:predicted O-methyltransferase YrrM
MAARPEPASDAVVASWIADELSTRDPFAAVAAASDMHRASHAGCQVYPSVSGHLLGVLAATAGARRILEIGGGLGYSTLWLAHGAGSAATVDTIEADPAHAGLLRSHATSHGLPARIVVHEGADRDILSGLAGHPAWLTAFANAKLIAVHR